MALAHSYGNGIVEALGLRDRKVRDFELRMAVDEVVQIRTLEYVTRDSVKSLERVLVEQRYQAVRWIPVEEALPDKSIPFGYVLVRGTEPDQYGCANLQYDGKWTLCDERSEWKVAFWMPFPEPPVTVTEQT